MGRKLPHPLTRPELEKVLEYLRDEREKRRKKRSGKLTNQGIRIHKYFLAIILASHAGLRISEIVGLRPEVSRCCKSPLNERRIRIGGISKKIKNCVKCNKEWSSGEVLRGKEGWDIHPLTPEKFEKDRIFVSQGKGEKDRWVWKPKLIYQKDMEYFPMDIDRRSLQVYFKKVAKDVLGKDLTFHSLRHTFATEYLRKFPADIRTLQVLLGHSRIDTTAIYSHVSIDDALQKASEVF
jgi:integrase/recombinase XerD